MILLHAGTGSHEIELLGPALPTGEWLRLRHSVVRLLAAQGRPGRRLLDVLPWSLHDGTNSFNDEFQLLFAPVPIEQYVKAEGYERNRAARAAATAIANAFDELGSPIRFIAFAPDIETTSAVVPAPRIDTSAEATSRALSDAEQLLQTSGAVSAVDRVHTTLHGYMKQLCSDARIDASGADSITALWKRLRDEDPALTQRGTHSEHVVRILSGIATILDALNLMRNRASLAHANEELLAEAEARLAVNSAWTIVHYLQAIVRA
jgi:hypothetical protein